MFFQDNWADDLDDCDGEGMEQYDQAYVDENSQINYEAAPQASVLTDEDDFPMEEKSVKREVPDLLCAVMELRAASKAISLSKQNMSENEAFGNYVAKSLDRLNPCDAVMCQQEIQTVITNYRLGQAQVMLEHKTDVK